MSTSGVLVRAVAAQFFADGGPNGEQNSPLDHRVMDFSILGRQLKFMYPCVSIGGIQ